MPGSKKRKVNYFVLEKFTKHNIPNLKSIVRLNWNPDYFRKFRLVGTYKAKLIVVAVLAVAAVSGAMQLSLRTFYPDEFSGANVATAKSADEVFTGDVNGCNTAPKEERFSCYRSAIEKRYRGVIPEDASLRSNLSFHSTDTSYAVFGTNCHTFYHAFGDYIATHYQSEGITAPMDSCSEDCTSGCAMGLIKRIALTAGYSTQKIKDLYATCPADSTHQCSHEVGHILHDKYVTSILKPIDAISLEKYGLKYSEKYNYTIYSTADLDAPFRECRAIVPAAEVSYCYTGIGHNLFLFSEFSHDSFDQEFSDCKAIAEKDRDNCLGFLIFRIGINDAATKYLAGDTANGNKVCDDTLSKIGRKDLLYHCFTGIGGGIGLYLDSEYDTETTTQYDPETQLKLLEKATLCDEASSQLDTSSDFVTNCYKGLFGTPFKSIYPKFKYKYPKLDQILGPIQKDNFQVVG